MITWFAIDEIIYNILVFIYCKPGVFDHLEGFEEQLQLGNISDYRCIRPKGTIFTGAVTSSSDRVAGVTIQADTIEEFNKKHREFVASVKILDVAGNDIMRRDLLIDLTESY